MEIFDELVESEVSIVTPHLKTLVEFCLQVGLTYPLVYNCTSVKLGVRHELYHHKSVLTLLSDVLVNEVLARMVLVNQRLKFVSHHQSQKLSKCQFSSPRTVLVTTILTQNST